MGTLYGKLALALLGIVVALAAALVVIARVATDQYFKEVTQRLNAEVAPHIVDEALLIDEGGVNRDALEHIAHSVMVINPSLEVYLLGADGEILAHAAPPGRVRRERVSLEPVRAFLAGDAKLPLLGDDPRDPQRRKIFSAAPVHDGERLAGYVYTVMGGEKYDAIAAKLQESYTMTVALAAIGAAAVLALLVGLAIFFLLTLRLRRLSRHVQAFTHDGFQTAEELALAPRGNDELDRLAIAFNTMAQRIVAQVGRLEETDRMRRELITNVSHDLRTPLASMQGYIETLLIKDDSLTPSERRHYLAIAGKHGARLQRLIGELFDLARLDSGAVQAKRESFCLSELLQDVGLEFQLKAAEQDVSLVVETGGGEACVVADIGLIQRVLENLIANALRYTPAGGHVHVSLVRGADNLGVSVADTGCGIEQGEIPRIFDRFYSSRAGGADHVGLGLAIVKRIVDLHGGSIVVESKPGKGTRFTFDLPSEAQAA